ncbi:peptidylprolyl isomerase [Rhodoblastus sp. 17X3]|uniref:peptidylprolyl isomerase n=1 Tax=Rhodoblastus sp. 17X3 TaxID=3047026 RepID=UPI0024B76E1A|nr:peptidylprolyl isomerase [Rhodoblastus sp. 17X3]MDI9849902.1 peptidylprolyl isomerase [Rhodoblastus sp. 17X3]
MSDIPQERLSLRQRLLREPLVHFMVLGGVLFGAYALQEGRRDGVEPSRRIDLTISDISQLVRVFHSQWRRDPAPEELRQLVEEKAREEILYREALALGLDKDDTIVKRRLAQKMQFLAEDVAAAHEPTIEELKTWYEANRERFAFPPRIGFRQLYFSTDRRGAKARDDAEAALAKLAGQTESASIAASLSDPSMFQDYYSDRTPEFLGKEFGPKFALAITKLASGSWQGPIESGFGWHLVYVDALIPGRVPAFEEIEPEVKQAWLAERKSQAWDKTYRDLRAKYMIFLPAPPEDAPAHESSKTEQSTPPGRKDPS